MLCVVGSLVHEENDLKATCRKLYKKVLQERKVKKSNKKAMSKSILEKENVKGRATTGRKNSKYKQIFVLFVDLTFFIFRFVFFYA